MGSPDLEAIERMPSEMLKFVTEHGRTLQVVYRVGQLLSHNRQPIATPTYVATTSRGVVPHLSHDVLQKHTQILAVYFGLEDFVEKPIQNAPILETPLAGNSSRLRQYTGLPPSVLSILGPRRAPQIVCPAPNTNSSISICTSVGFRTLDVEDYLRSTSILNADITTSLADLASGDHISKKRIAKSADRSHAWLRDTIALRETSQEQDSPLFASIPSLESEQQSFFLSDVEHEFVSHLSGICLYSPETTAILPQSLHRLPRLCLGDPITPHDVLKAVCLGVDLITIPFVTSTSEHGVAFTFTLNVGKSPQDEPLGIDLWSTDYASDLSPLTPACTCYTCTRHHRAYIHHLLQAKEMLAWTLLQIHNYSIIDRFFAEIRHSITQETFEEDSRQFHLAYESEMPKQTGAGPRVRGYQMKSIGGGEPKRNPKAYGKLDDQLQKLAEADSGAATPEGDSKELEQHGFAKRVE